MTKRVLVLFVCTSSLATAPDVPARPEVVFAAETVKVFVAEDRIRVEGTYVLTTTSSAEHLQRLVYPFPLDSLHLFPSDIAVTVEGQPVDFQQTDSAILFSIPLSASRPTSFRVVYGQPCLDNSACYILTSTAAWKNPLQHAAFEVHVPSKFELTWIAYEVDDDVDQGAESVYRFVRNNFMPDKDLCIRWRTREN